MNIELHMNQLTLKNNHFDLPKLMGDIQNKNSYGWNSREFQNNSLLIGGSCDVGGYLKSNDFYWHNLIDIEHDVIGTANMCGLQVLDKIILYAEKYKPKAILFNCARLVPSVFDHNLKLNYFANSSRLIRFLHAKRIIPREHREKLLFDIQQISNFDIDEAILEFTKKILKLQNMTNLYWTPSSTPEAQYFWDKYLDKILTIESNNIGYCNRVIPIDENLDNTIGTQTKHLVYETFRHFKL